MSATTMSSTPGGAKNESVAHRLSRGRRRTNNIVKMLCVAATAIGLMMLASILFTLLWRGLGGLSLTVFTMTTKPPGSNGGLLNAIVGTLIQT